MVHVIFFSLSVSWNYNGIFRKKNFLFAVKKKKKNLVWFFVQYPLIPMGQVSLEQCGGKIRACCKLVYNYTIARRMEKVIFFHQFVW